ncbi:Ino eighty subunit 2 [Microdochium nivale]|nr:Ino eighty subunit 2 [Microdochium nivale]
MTDIMHTSVCLLPPCGEDWEPRCWMAWGNVPRRPDLISPHHQSLRQPAWAISQPHWHPAPLTSHLSPPATHSTTTPHTSPRPASQKPSCAFLVRQIGQTEAAVHIIQSDASTKHRQFARPHSSHLPAMTFRPRRVAAQKANTAITDMVDSENTANSPSDSIVMSSRPSRRSDVRSPAERPRSGPSGGRSSGVTSRSALARENFVGGEILEGKRNRSQRKSYRVDSSEDDDDAPAEDDLDAEGEDEDDDDMVDANREIVVDADMDVDAEGEEDDDVDADGEDEMDVDPTPPPRQSVKVARPAAARTSVPSKPKETARAPTKAAARQEESDDEELSDLDSDADEIQDTVNVGGGEEEDDEEEDDEEDDELGGGDDEEDEEPRELDSDDEGSDGGSPDLDKMTKRQRARFVDDDDGALLKLSDEVQAKKVFTAEELSMRRAEMARRRRNLSEKRNEEVKMETIHKLLHKQAPKINRKALLAEEQAAAEKPSPIFVRWVNNKAGSIVAVPDEMLGAPPGRVFVPGGLKSGKMVEEVS